MIYVPTDQSIWPYLFWLRIISQHEFHIHNFQPNNSAIYMKFEFLTQFKLCIKNMNIIYSLADTRKLSKHIIQVFLFNCMIALTLYFISNKLLFILSFRRKAFYESSYLQIIFVNTLCPSQNMLMPKKNIW